MEDIEQPDSPFREEVEVNEEDELMFQNADSVPEASGTSSRKDSRRSLRFPLATCRSCGRSYYSLDGYKSHLKAHLFEDFLRDNAPMREVFLTQCQEEAKVILNDMLKFKGSHGMTEDCVKIACSLLSSEKSQFIDCVASELWTSLPAPSSITLPSFHSAYVKAVNSFLSDSEKRQVLIGQLEGSLPDEHCNEVLQWFIGYFTFKMAVKAEVFFFKYMQAPHEVLLPTVRVDNVEDVMFQCSVYYVGGSCVKSILRQAHRSTQNVTWNKVVTCITNKFLCGPLSSAPPQEVTAWTDSVDRGGLQHINENVFFLMALTPILNLLEEVDGSVSHEKVLSEVKNDAIMVLWNENIQESLEAEESDFLLSKFLYFYINTWGEGVKRRRLNQEKCIQRDKVSFRASLLTRGKDVLHSLC